MIIYSNTNNITSDQVYKLNELIDSGLNLVYTNDKVLPISDKLNCNVEKCEIVESVILDSNLQIISGEVIAITREDTVKLNNLDKELYNIYSLK